MRATIAETVENMIALAFVMVQRRPRMCRDEGAKLVHGVISRRQVQWYVWGPLRLSVGGVERLDSLEGMPWRGFVLQGVNGC